VYSGLDKCKGVTGICSCVHVGQDKGDRKRRPRVQTQVNGTPIEALVDSGASVSVMSEKAFKTMWEHWKMQRLPLPAALTVSGVNREKIDVTGYVKIPLQMEDGKTGEVRTFTRPVLVLSGTHPMTHPMTSSKRKG
jgi:hypothetical protein